MRKFDEKPAEAQHRGEAENPEFWTGTKTADPHRQTEKAVSDQV